MTPEWGKWTDNGQNLISSEAGHHTYEIQTIPPVRSPENVQLACFTKPKWYQNKGKSTYDDPNLISFESGQDTFAYQISGHSEWLQ